MGRTVNLLAFDIGAESGRGVIGSFDGQRMRLSEVHRFINGPMRLGDRLHWNVLRLYDELKKGMAAGARECCGEVASMGLSTWGLDYGLLDRRGELLSIPYCYRDSRTNGMMEKVFHVIPREEIFEHTGVQSMQVNALYQLYATALEEPRVLDAAGTLLMMPDLFNYWLTGSLGSEITIASTSQFLEARTRQWSFPVFERLGLPVAILPALRDPGTEVGPLLACIAEDTGLKNLAVIAPACHDTASAVSAVPLSGERPFAYISSGTWSPIGTEVQHPVINALSLANNFTNERGLGGRFLFRKNIMGFWILQECRRTWAAAGRDWSYAELLNQASVASPFGPMIEPDDSTFLPPGDMPQRIASFCLKTRQAVPRDVGETSRCIIESLALKHRWVLEKTEEMLGQRIEVIHLLGGGANNPLFCQLTADATGPVMAGPAEAATVGNLLMQAQGRYFLSSIQEAREVVRRSFEIPEYTPRQPEAWQPYYEAFLAMRKQLDAVL